MNSIAIALFPIFLASLAIQQLTELLIPFVIRVTKRRDRRLVIGLISLAAAAVIVFGCGIRLLVPIGVAADDTLDGVIAMFIISAGVKGARSTSRILVAAKERRKASMALLLKDPFGRPSGGAR